MKTKIDSLGRIIVPKAFRVPRELTAGTPLDITLYGSDLQISPTGRHDYPTAF